MGDPKGFLKIKRQNCSYRSIDERVKDFHEVAILPENEHSQEQSSRCMDCGTPFCHWGCPLGNYIPEWNQFIAEGLWEKAFTLLVATNNMPEITGRICPALCEYACVLGINDEAVTIRENELAIIEYAFKHGFIKPFPPQKRSGKNVAVIGSGPSGLACAAQLNRAGHKVVVFEKADKIGGILRYGIPYFKLEKWVIDRRLDIWKKEGIEFRVNVDVGGDYPTSELLKNFDAVCLASGSRVPRDLNIKGRNLKGIHFALDYLTQSNKRVAHDSINGEIIDAKGEKVVIIGGGDTGSDCVGTAHRQGASSVVQIEVLPKPPEHRTESMPWPTYPSILKTTSSHQEGGERYWSVLTKEFIGEGGRLKKLNCVKVEFSPNKENGRLEMKEIPGSEFEIEADLAILAVGFLHPEHKGLISDLGLKLDKRGNIETDGNFMSSRPGIFAAGDARTGQSLVVNAISEGRRAAYHIDTYLMGKSWLPII